MKQTRIAALLCALSLLAGCASSMQLEATDAKKAAHINAELGLNYMSQGRHELAMEKLQRALEYDSASADAHHYLAELYRRLERPDKSREHYRRALGLAPKDASIQNNYGIFLCTDGQYDEGIKYLALAVENPVWSGRAGAFENLGRCYQDKGDNGKSEQYYREALQLDAALPGALLGMADLSLQQGNTISSRAFLQRYSAVALHTPQSLWIGIQVERELGDRNALASYSMLLRNNFPDAEETQLYLNSK